MANLAARFPTGPMVDAQGRVTQDWLYFFQQLFFRTGGSPGGIVSAPGGANGNVQYNSSGTFGGLTNVQLTARIQTFTSSLNGAAPGSGGGTTNFLRADGTWVAPAAAGSASGDLTGSYPGPTVSKINGVALGTTTATSGNLLIGSGTAWVTNAMSGDATINSGGTLAVGAVNGVTYPASPSKNTVPVVTGTGTVTYETVPVAAGGTGATTATGTGNTVLATNPTLAGVTVDGDGSFHLTSQTSDAKAATGTLTNAPTAGNPGFWLRLSINGTAYAVPAWVA